jgi:type I restriction enzyme S subunit
MTTATSNQGIHQLRTYHRTGSAVFLKTKEKYGGLSNMAGGFPLVVNDIKIRTSEALYQACRFPHMPEIQRLIIEQKSPMTAKMKGKPHRQNSRPDWDTVRVKIMRWCLRVKLAQNWDSFRELLLETANLPIVEQSRRDDFWGAKPVDKDTLIGINALGRLLMELREQVKDDPSKLLHVDPLPIPNFLLYERQIEVIGDRGVIGNIGSEQPLLPGIEAS